MSAQGGNSPSPLRKHLVCTFSPTLYVVLTTRVAPCRKRPFTTYLPYDIPFQDDNNQTGPPMTSTDRQGSLPTTPSEQVVVCSVCYESRPRSASIQLECEHQYCIDCAKALFVRATHDETLFPPRCCTKPINTELVKRHMTAEEREAFESASSEFVAINRVYCSNRLCGKFLRPARIDGGSTTTTRAAVCTVCGTRTCCICKSGFHYKDKDSKDSDCDCPEDPELCETRELALANRWQTCPGCNRLVQLRSGCNHIKCHCKTEFCYSCGVRWKTCSCEVANEAQLIEGPEEEVLDPDMPVENSPRFRDGDHFVELWNGFRHLFEDDGLPVVDLALMELGVDVRGFFES